MNLMLCMFNLKGFQSRARAILAMQLNKEIDPCQAGYHPKLTKREQNPKIISMVNPIKIEKTPDSTVMFSKPKRPIKVKIKTKSHASLPYPQLNLKVIEKVTPLIAPNASVSIPRISDTNIMNAMQIPQVVLVRTNIPNSQKESTESQSTIEPMQIQHQEDLMPIEAMMPSPVPMMLSPMSVDLNSLFESPKAPT